MGTSFGHLPASPDDLGSGLGDSGLLRNVIPAPRILLIDCDFLISSVYNDARDANFFLQNDTTLSSIFPGFELPSSNDACVIIFQTPKVITCRVREATSTRR
jgi:hypothetical protein